MRRTLSAWTITLSCPHGLSPHTELECWCGAEEDPQQDPEEEPKPKAKRKPAKKRSAKAAPAAEASAEPPAPPPPPERLPSDHGLHVTEVLINRAPVLTLWVGEVAKRQG